jgi:hypothetical protein
MLHLLDMNTSLRFRAGFAILATTVLASLAGCAAEVPEGENQDVAADDVFGSSSKLVAGVYDIGRDPTRGNTILVYKGTLGGARVALAGGPSVRFLDTSVSVRSGRSFITYQVPASSKKIDLELVQNGTTIEVVGGGEVLEGSYTRRDSRTGSAALLGKYQELSPAGTPPSGERLELLKGVGEEVTYSVTTQGKTFNGTASMRPDSMHLDIHTQIMETKLGACRANLSIMPTTAGYLVQLSMADDSSACPLKRGIVTYNKIP